MRAMAPAEQIRGRLYHMNQYFMDCIHDYQKSGRNGTPQWKRSLILLRDMSRPGWRMLLFIAAYLAIFTLLEKMTRLHYSVIHLPLDDIIPFCEVFIIPYLLWFPFMIINECYFYFCDPDTFHRSARMLCFGMSVFLFVSMVFPNIQYLRPAVMPRDNVFTRMVASLYRTDTPTNICPSIHVFNTLVVMTCLRKSTYSFLHRHKVLMASQLILGVLIILSTMFIKQHSVFDVLCAFCMALAVYIVEFRPDLLPGYAKRKRPAAAEQ